MNTNIDWTQVQPWVIQKHNDCYVVKIDVAPERHPVELYADSNLRLMGFRSPKSRVVGYQLQPFGRLRIWESANYIGLFRNITANNLSPSVEYSDQSVQLRSFQAKRSRNYIFAIRWR